MKKRNAAAAVFMGVAIAASIPLGINRSLDRLKDDVEEKYFYDQAGYSIGDGLEIRRDAAYNLVSLAEKYADKAPELQGLIDELERQLAISENTWYDLTEEEARANLGLDAPAEALAAALEKLELSDQDKKYPGQMLGQMRSEQDKINRSSYNEEARAFNAKVERLSPMALTKPMADFSASAAEPSSAEVEEAAENMGFPEAPEAPAAPEAPEAPAAEEFEQRVDQWAEELGDSVESGVEGLVDGVGDMLDGIFQ